MRLQGLSGDTIASSSGLHNTPARDSIEPDALNPGRSAAVELVCLLSRTFSETVTVVGAL